MAIRTMKDNNKSPKGGGAGAATSPTTKNHNRKKKQPNKKGTGLNDMFIVVFGMAFALCLSLNVLHGIGNFDNVGDDDDDDYNGNTISIHTAKKDFKMKRKNKKSHQKESASKNHHNIIENSQELLSNNANHHLNHNHDGQEQKGNNNNNQVLLSTLNCDAFGGPTISEAQEMVYWSDIPSDENWISPFHPKRKKGTGQYVESTKYLTFEPDGGGWNNIRMAMESVIAIAVAMGRTLVMPPQKRMYLLAKGDNNQRSHFEFADFFPIDEMANEHIGLDVISMKEYLDREAMTGKLRNKLSGSVEFPPGNRTDWNGIMQDQYDVMRGYLRNVSTTARWKPDKCLPAFPKSGNHKDVEFLKELITKAKKINAGENYEPVPVDTENVLSRLEESLNNRKDLCVYDEKLQNEQYLHFQMNHKEHLRLLTHFYGFIFFEDWKEDLWMKRFIRDHVRYIDEVQCAAARIVASIRKHVKQRDPKNIDGIFDTFHIRRGDFQFKVTRIPAEEILANSIDKLTPNSTIFIATDERDKKFFDPFRQKGFDILFLDDFKEHLANVNTNLYGMIDQLIASRGRVFFGCWHSTFTGFINRLRGYHSQNDKAPGYEKGLLPTTYYYATKEHKFEMHKYSPINGAFFNREYPISWRDINKGIGMLPTADAATG